MRTWLKEQIVFCLCLAPGAAFALMADHTFPNVYKVSLGCMTALIAQKIRGAAARKQEAHQDYLDSIGSKEKITLSCEAKIERWSIVGQFLGVIQGFVAIGHLPLVQRILTFVPVWAFMQFYGAYRERKRLKNAAS